MTITFTGDLCISGRFVDTLANGADLFSEEISTELKNTDYVVANLEGPVTNTKAYINNNTPLKSPPNSISYLASHNINVYNLANNHILDYGEQGLHDSILEIEKNNCFYFGAGHSIKKKTLPCILTKNGISVGIIGVSLSNPIQVNNAHIFSSTEFKSLKKVIKEIRTKVNHVIINFHGGEEYSLYPSPPKRKFLKKLASINGVSIVIAHHSHTFQGVEKVNNVPIFYSLGNFIFDIPNHKIHEHTNYGALLKLKLTKNSYDYDLIPFSIATNGIINPLTDFNFKKHFSEISNFTSYTKKWRKEAFKILFRASNPKIENAEQDKKALQNKSVLALFISRKFYTKIFLIFNDKTMRSIYFNAIIHKFALKFRHYF